MLDQARRPEAGGDHAAADTHVEASPELQRLARTVVTDQASHATGHAAGNTIELPYRAEMEQRFGRSFGDVRVQVDPAAAAAVGARAYTMGRDIMFATATPDRELVAHELSHVVQQREGRARDVASDEAQAQSGELESSEAQQGESSTPQLRKDAVLNPHQIKEAIAFNNAHWHDPHRTEILRNLRAEVSSPEFEEPDVVRVASMQQMEGVDPKSIDGKLGAGTMAILLRKGLHLSELKVKPNQVQLMFYPGEFEDLKAWQEAREKARKDAKGDREKEFGEMYKYAPAGHGTIYVKVDGNVVDRVQARGGPPFTMHDRGHTADPSQAGTYKLGAGKSVVTKSWSTSQIAWGAPIREHDGNIEFKNPGENWRVAVKGDEEVLGIPKSEFYESDAKLSSTWRKNDFGETGFRVEGSPGLYIHTGPDTEEKLKEECTAQGKDEQHVVHKPMELDHSHGCLHVDPYDRNRWMRTGYLQKGVTITIKKYEDVLDVASPNRK